METIELSRNNWIFLILAVMIFTFASCTKDEIVPDIDGPSLERNDAIPEFHQGPDKTHQ